MLIMIPVTSLGVAVYSEIPVHRVLVLQDERLIPNGSCRYSGMGASQEIKVKVCIGFGCD